jgi:hypothetical protein
MGGFEAGGGGAEAATVIWTVNPAALALTVVRLGVLAIVFAIPVASVVTTTGAMEPAATLKVTGTLGTKWPSLVNTVAVTSSC